jgi:hypothetical protein
MSSEFQAGCSMSFHAVIIALFSGGFIACVTAAGGEPRWWQFGLAGFFIFGGSTYAILLAQSRAVWMARNMPYPVTAVVEPEQESDYPAIDNFDLWQDALSIVDCSIETNGGSSGVLIGAKETWEQTGMSNQRWQEATDLLLEQGWIAKTPRQRTIIAASLRDLNQLRSLIASPTPPVRARVSVLNRT